MVETEKDLTGICTWDDRDKFIRWAGKQRALGKRGELRPDRQALFKKIGFWKTQSAGAAAPGPQKVTSSSPIEITSVPSMDSNTTNSTNNKEEDSALAAPISKEAVEIATMFYQTQAAQEKEKYIAITKTTAASAATKKMKAADPALATTAKGNQLPPLQVPAHVKRMQTMQYFQHRRAVEGQEKTGGGGGAAGTTTADVSFEEQMRRKYLGGGSSHGDKDDEDENDSEDSDNEEEAHYGQYNDDSSDDEDPDTVAQAAAEQTLREAIEASELSQRQKADESSFLASASKPKAPHAYSRALSFSSSSSYSCAGRSNTSTTTD